MKCRLLCRAMLLILFCLPEIGLPNHGVLKGKYSKEKQLKKTFNVSSEVLLEVENSYGNLNITSWLEDRIVIEVHIKTSGNNEDKVQEKLNNIDVEFEQNATSVSAKTIFERNSSNWGWNWGRNNTVDMQINYVIKVPVKARVDLENDYGSIHIDRIDGHAKIICDYGRLNIGSLNGRENQLNFDYTSKSTINYMKSGKISADYSGFTIEKAGDLEISADYTNSSVGKMGNLRYASDYGKLDIGEVKNVQGNGDYISVGLGVVHGDVDISSDYGSLSIARMAADAGDLKVDSGYTGVKIGYDAAYHFNFEIRSSYSGVSGKDAFQINISEEKNTSKYYKGYYGSSDSQNDVSINSEYGGISFYKNN